MSNEIDDGGAAFPLYIPEREGAAPKARDGMTLRDYFAGKAMESIAGHIMGNIMSNLEGETPPADKLKRELAKLPPIIAPIAYALADGMLATRNSATPENL